MKTKFLYILGSASGSGKSTICEGVLSQCLANGIQPKRLAYIKPMTQCTVKQAVALFCEHQGIAFCDIGNIVFNKGFTKRYIDGLTKKTNELLSDTLRSIAQIGVGKDLVVVDGVGSPATGSVIGLSNVDLVRALSAPVVYIGKSGIGAAIDDAVFSIKFMQLHDIREIGLLFNKIPPSQFDTIQHYTRQRLNELLPNTPILGFISEFPKIDAEEKLHAALPVFKWFQSLP